MRTTSFSFAGKDMNARDILRKPYARRLTPDETGGFVGTIQEFPGLVAEGETAEETYRNLEAAAESWLGAAIATGAPIPEPLEERAYSGRIALRLPCSIHRRAAEAAEADCTSLNQLLVTATAFYLGIREGSENLGAELRARSQRQIEDWSKHRQMLVTYLRSAQTSVAGRLETSRRDWLTEAGSGGHVYQILRNLGEAQLGIDQVGFQLVPSIGNELWQTQPSTHLVTKN